MPPDSPSERTSTGWFYDGQSAARHRAQLLARNGWLGITTDEKETIWWPLAETRCERSANAWRVERIITNAIAPYVVIDDSGFGDFVASFSARGGHTSADTVKWLIALGLAGFVFLVFLWKIGLPWTAATLAERVPADWEESFGRKVAAAMAPESVRCADPAAVAAVEKLAGSLKSALTLGDAYDYHVVVADGDVVNAFAAPGGSIVIYRGLIDRMATPDEFAAVLAHEMQHVAHRHSTRAIFRNFAIQSLVAFMFGDPTGLLSQAAGQLSVLKYMREDEEEADRDGMVLLARAGYDPRGMIDMLETLSEVTRGQNTEGLAWLTSHPSTKSRIEQLQRILPLPDHAARPALTPAEWKALRTACQDK